MLAVGARLVYLQAFQHEALAERARKQQQATAQTNAPRGLILDRRGRELARSLERDSYFVEPVNLEDARAAARQLAPALGLDEAELGAQLEEAKRRQRKFVWLARELEPERAEKLKGIKLAGVGSVKEPKRYYPNGALAAHVLGFVGLDDEGLAGVERFQDVSLGGDAGRVRFGKDGRAKKFESSEAPAREGDSVVLTIDQNIQYQAEQVLGEAVARARAKSGAALVLDPRTGEILALANAPTFDPNDASRVPAELRVNHSLQYIYEPGSTFKLVAYSAALEEKLARPEDRIDCQGGAITLFGRTVHDSHAYGTLTVTEALAKSSNVAAIKLGLRVGNDRLFDYIKRFGFGDKTGVELPGETRGLLRDVKRWQPTSIGSIPIGQEIGVTPVQMAAAFGAVANDGLRLDPHLVREVRDEAGNVVRRARPQARQVVSTETARTLRRMLENVTLDGGTAKTAALDGYTAAGKTGTAQKIDPKTRAYSKTKYVASFVGFAPVEQPAVVIIVVIDEPVGAYYGGQVAAPVFKELAERVLPYLDVAPDAETEEPARGDVARNAARGEVADYAHAPAEHAGTPGQQEPQAMSSEDADVAALLPEVAKRGAGAGGVGEVVYAVASERALVMPDVRGQSLRDAARICAQLGLELEAHGEGRAVGQGPAAGARVEAGQTVRVYFGRGD